MQITATAAAAALVAPFKVDRIKRASSKSAIFISRKVFLLSDGNKVRLIHINYFELNSATWYSRPDGTVGHPVYNGKL
uniref:Uncharacterized protein n=1 Tax=Romanomermis culicivorax TaxID=13658 RepID=A0A915KMY3_ROMCU